jgi:hypothetical protein
MADSAHNVTKINEMYMILIKINLNGLLFEAPEYNFFSRDMGLLPKYALVAEIIAEFILINSDLTD